MYTYLWVTRYLCTTLNISCTILAEQKCRFKNSFFSSSCLAAELTCDAIRLCYDMHKACIRPISVILTVTIRILFLYICSSYIPVPLIGQLDYYIGWNVRCEAHTVYYDSATSFFPIATKFRLLVYLQQSRHFTLRSFHDRSVARSSAKEMVTTRTKNISKTKNLQHKGLHVRQKLKLEVIAKNSHW